MEGANIQALEQSVADTAVQMTEEELWKCNKIQNQDYTYEDIKLNFKGLWPSDTFIMNIFLLDYNFHKHVYEQQMDNIGASSISMDHTFKVSSNIGYKRSDGSWQTIYDNLFLIMNEHGQVMNFKFTKSTAFEHIKSQEEQVRDKLLAHNITHIEASVDNCCSWRKLLQQALNQINTSVKLDLFHGIA